MEAIKLTFAEASHFYEALDSCIKLGPVVVSFGDEKPGNDSKLWPRLKKCQGWERIEQEFVNVSQGKDSPIRGMIAPSFAQRLTGLEAAVIVTLIVAVWSAVMYAIYKDRDVEVVVDPDTGSGKLVIKKKSDNGASDDGATTRTA